TAFQLIDDVLDYSGNAATIGKNVGDDLREGKPTLPLIYLLQHGTQAQRELVRSSIEQGDVTHFDQILAAITESGALEYTRQQAQTVAQSAAAAISSFRASEFKDSLLQLCAFAVERDR